MTDKPKPTLADGGAKQTGTDITRSSDPALQKEGRQAVRNQSQVAPEDYPERTEGVA